MPADFERQTMTNNTLQLFIDRTDTPIGELINTFVASVADRPAGSIISVLMKSPGRGGFFMAKRR
jgi:hypothetical protein